MSFIRVLYVILFLTTVHCTITAQDVALKKNLRGDKVVVSAENKSSVSQLVTLDVKLENVIPDKELPLELVLEPGEERELVVLSPIPLKPWSYKTKFSYVEYVAGEENVLRPSGKPLIPNNAPHTVSQPSESDSVITLYHGDPASVKYAASTTDYYLLPPENSDDAPMPAVYARVINHKNKDDFSTRKRMTESKLLLFGQAGCPRCSTATKYLKEHAIPFQELSITGNDKNEALMNKYLFDGGFEGGKFMMPVVVVDGETYYSIPDLSVFLEGLGSDR